MVKKMLLIVVAVILFVSLSLVLFAHFKSEQLFYYPDQVEYGRTPQYYQQRYEDIWIATEDGERLHGWFIPSALHEDTKDALGTVLHYHGNAANITAQYSHVAWLPTQGFNVITFDYRGYGKSTGYPDFDGIFKDGVAALKFAHSFSKIDADRLFIIGQSLGGNVAIASVGSADDIAVKGMIIDSTFYSYPLIANDKLPGAKYLIRDVYSAYRFLPNLQLVPIFYVHGTADQVIPYYHSEKLYDETAGVKEMLILPSVHHIEGLYLPQVQIKIINFFKQDHRYKAFF